MRIILYNELRWRRERGVALTLFHVFIGIFDELFSWLQAKRGGLGVTSYHTPGIYKYRHTDKTLTTRQDGIPRLDQWAKRRGPRCCRVIKLREEEEEERAKGALV